ncbi:sigma-70 family RNA polymerase sigma factor [Actinoplanes sp. CA-252034]|uniref:sigma-70 family RNA polymerase sigma factor n=1 Tax=Actinoplanes sp. CA-252034 TaxID=3239906 RepID=UPI003D971C13
MTDVLSGADLGPDAVDRREALRRALAVLPVRERRVIGLRFVGEMTQAQIAARIGVSQMQASRLLTRSLIRLRDALQADGATAEPDAGRAGPVRQVVGAGSSGGR